MNEIRAWIKSEKFNIFLTVSSGILLIILDKLLDYTSHIDDFEFNLKIEEQNNYLIQSLFILITLIVLLRNRKSTYEDLSKDKQLKQYIARKCNIKIKDSKTIDSAYKVVTGTVNQFYTAWIMIWFIWFIYYFGNYILGIGKPEIGIDIANSDCIDGIGNIGIFYKIRNIFSHFFDFLSSTALYGIYLILNDVTVNIRERSKHDEGLRYGALCFIVIFAIFISFVLLEASTISCEEYKKYDQITSLLLSTFSAISFVLVLGKLNSNYLQIPRFFLYGLYIYAIIQLYEPFKSSGCGDIKYISTIINYTMPYITLVGKICLMLTLTWIVYEKRFIFYVIHKSLSLAETPDMLDLFNKNMSDSND